ncbi:aldo/keto reductase [Candidatus Epulonipiscium viviparus]|uniref:aldo/keto reductase n=1 Tax=Candidatus Epulonipiscium viviparus TaxID=420336 RepID=UPI00016C0D6B|nr:aldo/keto reductase [Candidatus Epulopiscium viviparus]
MKKILIKEINLEVPEIALGCMRINRLSQSDAQRLIQTALDEGINFFDHADIYGAGEAEKFFSQAIEMNSSIREKMILQSKCCIKKGLYEASKEHIIYSVDNSLKNLQTDYLDILLLHRPDALIEPEEVAETFDELKKSGKVKYFGVSNFNAYQIQLLNQYCSQKMAINQLQLSIPECKIIDSGLNVNTSFDAGINRDGSILDYCRLNNITIQAWSPFQKGFISGTFLDNPEYGLLNSVIYELTQKYSVSNSAIAVAWILRHPAKIQTIVGTTNFERLQNIAKASQITLTREEWYRLYTAAGKHLP